VNERWRKKVKVKHRWGHKRRRGRAGGQKRATGKVETGEKSGKERKREKGETGAGRWGKRDGKEPRDGKERQWENPRRGKAGIAGGCETTRRAHGSQMGPTGRGAGWGRMETGTKVGGQGARGSQHEPAAVEGVGVGRTRAGERDAATGPAGPDRGAKPSIYQGDGPSRRG